MRDAIDEQLSCLPAGMACLNHPACRRLESRKRGRGGEWVADFSGWRVGWSSLELSFPLCGNGLPKPLDSGLRRNDGGGCRQEFARHGKGAIGMATCLFSPRRHSSEGWNPGNTDNFCQYLPKSASKRLCASRASWPLCPPALLERGKKSILSPCF